MKNQTEQETKKQCLTGEIRERAILEGVDVIKLDKEFNEVGLRMLKSEKEAREFLKKKMGIILYTFWNIPYYLSLSPLCDYEDQYFIIKAKKLGWKDTFEYPKEF